MSTDTKPCLLASLLAGALWARSWRGTEASPPKAFGRVPLGRLGSRLRLSTGYA